MYPSTWTGMLNHDRLHIRREYFTSSRSEVERSSRVIDQTSHSRNSRLDSEWIEADPGRLILSSALGRPYTASRRDLTTLFSLAGKVFFSGPT
jgi:uncharacterized secreted protein with C-terminal beta-propeller domain